MDIENGTRNCDLDHKTLEKNGVNFSSILHLCSLWIAQWQTKHAVAVAVNSAAIVVCKNKLVLVVAEKKEARAAWPNDLVPAEVNNRPVNVVLPESKMQKEVLFVYNGDASMFGKVTDFAHKVIAPATYPCQLCKLTYGSFAMKKAWKEFLASRHYKVDFLHRDEWLQKYPTRKERLPAIFSKENDEWEMEISAQEIEKTKDLEQLIKLMKDSHL